MTDISFVDRLIATQLEVYKKTLRVITPIARVSPLEAEAIIRRYGSRARAPASGDRVTLTTSVGEIVFEVM